MNADTGLDERVQVICVFGPGLNPCRPLKFRRANGQTVTISEIGLRHPVSAGRRTLHIFDVTDGMSEYRLAFDSERLSWRLVAEVAYD